MDDESGEDDGSNEEKGTGVTGAPWTLVRRSKSHLGRIQLTKVSQFFFILRHVALNSNGSVQSVARNPTTSVSLILGISRLPALRVHPPKRLLHSSELMRLWKRCNTEVGIHGDA